jgi:exopolysaccharide production protein ExoZ
VNIDAHRPEPAKPGLGSFLGDASYSIYLVHGPILSLLFKVAVSRGWVAQISPLLVTTAIVILTTAAGCLFHRVVERPLLQYCRRS